MIKCFQNQQQYEKDVKILFAMGKASPLTDEEINKVKIELKIESDDALIDKKEKGGGKMNMFVYFLKVSEKAP